MNWFGSVLVGLGRHDAIARWHSRKGLFAPAPGNARRTYELALGEGAGTRMEEKNVETLKTEDSAPASVVETDGLALGEGTRTRIKERNAETWKSGDSAPASVAGTDEPASGCGAGTPTKQRNAEIWKSEDSVPASVVESVSPGLGRRGTIAKLHFGGRLTASANTRMKQLSGGSRRNRVGTDDPASGVGLGTQTKERNAETAKSGWCAPAS